MKCQNLKWGWFIALLLLVSSCQFENINFKEATNFKLREFKERKLKVTFDLVLENPNAYTIKVKPSSFDLFINGHAIDIVHLDEKVSILKKSESRITVPVTGEIQQGAIPKLLPGLLKKTASVRIVGTAKGSVGIFGKKKKIDETREIPLRNLDLKSLPFLN